MAATATKAAAAAAAMAAAIMEQALTNAIVLRRFVKSNGCVLIKSSCAYFFRFSGIGASADLNGQQIEYNTTEMKFAWI